MFDKFQKEGNNGNRSLANLFTVRNQSETGSHCGQSEIVCILFSKYSILPIF